MDVDVKHLEANRLEALHRYGILDSPREQVYDDIVQIAKALCDVPIALISLVDRDRQWFKAEIGLGVQETKRCVSFCSHAIGQPDQFFIIPDARLDERFKDNPLVVSEPRIRFYAGMSLVDENGYALGTLCVIDDRPRNLCTTQLESLRALARQAVRQIQINHKLAQLEESELRFNTFMDCSPAIAFLKDEQGRYVYINETYSRRLNKSAQEVIGKDDFQIWPYDTAKNIRAHDLDVLVQKRTISVVETVADDNGKASSWQVVKFLLHADEHLVGGVGIDISEAKQYEARLEETQRELQEKVELLKVLSSTDPLTQLKNRRALEQSLEREWSFARRYKLPLSILMMDLDHFKRVNDTLGHAAGDEAIRTLGEILRKGERANDCAARYGGEEFVVMLRNTSLQGALLLAERLRKETQAKIVTTVSIGVATLQESMKQPFDLIRAADQALYKAKDSGRNCVATVS